MSDIVERLRKRHENCDNVYAYSEAIETYHKDRVEAADEIERLREALDRSRPFVKYCENMLGASTALALIDFELKDGGDAP